MKLIRRAATIAAAAAIAVTGLITPTASADDADVYTVPGGHQVNGRLWQTSCEKYSTTVVRCRTDIFAKMVVREDNRYISAYDFFFNNLTYLPSDRAQWAGNPLATKGDHTVNGRQWRTECDTPATGRGACRTYLKAKFVAFEDGKYVTKNDYIFNNIVRFAQGSIAPVTEIPQDVLLQSKLDFSGLGPLQFGSTARDLELLGYARLSDVCEAWGESDRLLALGIRMELMTQSLPLSELEVDHPRFQTVDGAAVGMTIAQVKAIYGTRFQVVAKTNFGATQYFGSVRSGDRELMFRVDGSGDNYAPERPLTDSDVVASIIARPYSTDVSRDGC